MEGMGPAPPSVLNPSGTEGTWDPLSCYPEPPMGRGSVGAKGPILPRIMKSVWVEVAAPAAFPNPPGARAGCQPQHGQPRPPPETPRTRLFTAALGERGSPAGTGGEVHTTSTPTKHHFGSPGLKLSRAAFCQLSSPSNPGFGERSIAPQLLPPGRAPAGWGGRGLRESNGLAWDPEEEEARAWPRSPGNP
ncbi:collagen alpha-1(III) chain-like [Catharus ustulatus]|uniref:collagen alpha-1(III) chain-like n=1 Tax=Catharus ustulatus TaxID=91951 RepID=UPI00140DEA24|nr:collagen alpha-1(III) chain-like [Catharus ustulatus]